MANEAPRRMMTDEEWRNDAKPPFHYIKVRNDSWGGVERDMIRKWIEEHLCSGWVYYDGNSTYVFQKGSDFAVFKMWIKDNPFENDDGEIPERV